MKNIKFFAFFLIVFILNLRPSYSQFPSKCLIIESILVDACGNPEGANEMLRLRVGANPVNVQNISFTWPNNPWRGFCQNSQTSLKTQQIYNNITGCGYVVHTNILGQLPPGANVLVVLSEDFDVSANPFTNLNDTIYILYQCSGNTTGHFANWAPNLSPNQQLRTTSVLVSGANGCVDDLTYNRSMLTNQNGGIGGSAAQRDGARVDADWLGNLTYINQGCNAPFQNTTVNLINSTDACIGETIDLLPQIGGPHQSVLWQGGSGSFASNSQANTQYTLSNNDITDFYLYLNVIEICGDTLKDSVLVEVKNQAISITSSDTSICQNGGDVFFQSSNTNGTWHNSGSISAINQNGVFNSQGLNAGVYDVYFISNNICEDSDTLQIEITQGLQAQIDTIGLLCQNDSIVQLSANINTGIWSELNNANFITSSGLFNPQLAGVGLHTIIFSPNVACSTADTLVVEVVSVPDASFVIPNNLCFFELPYTLSASNSGTWDVLQNPSAVNNNGVFNPNIAGSFDIVHTVSGICQNSDTMIVNIQNNVTANINLTSNQLCLGEITTFTSNTLGGQWHSIPNGLIEPNSGIFDSNISGVGNFMISYSDSANCVLSSDTIITVNAIQYPTIINFDAVICIGEKDVFLEADLQGGNWSLNIGNQFISNNNELIVENLQEGNYQLIYQLTGFCQGADTLAFQIKDVPQVEIVLNAPSNIICDKEEVILTAVSDENNFLWSNNENTAQIEVNISDWYYVNISNECGNASDSVNIIFSELFADFDVDINFGEAPLEVNFQNNSQNAISYLWNFEFNSSSNEINPSHTFENQGQYLVTLIALDSLNCSDTAHYDFINVFRDAAIYIPNVFTPNSDGLNDVFKVEGVNFKIKNFQIYNRWGQLIFESQKENAFWDGTDVNNKEYVQAGVYFYVIEIIQSSGVVTTKYGDISLLR